MSAAARSCGHAASVHCAHCRVRSISVCAALEPDDVDLLGRLAHDLRTDARDVIAEEGETASSLFNVTDGAVSVYRLLEDGRRQIFAFLLPGDFLGLSLEARYGWTAEALVPSALCRFERKAFEDIARAHPKFLARLTAAASHEMSLARDHIVMLGRASALQRVAAFVSDLGARWQRTGLAAGDVPLPMTREDIADHLGLTLETVSRSFTALARQGAIELRPGGARIADEAMLARASRGEVKA